MGAGNLVASLLLSALPLTGDPDRLTTRQVVLLLAALATVVDRRLGPRA